MNEKDKEVTLSYRKVVEFLETPKKMGDIADGLNMSRMRLMDITRDLLVAKAIESAGIMSYKSTPEAMDVVKNLT